jgi:hypothetical protein
MRRCFGPTNTGSRARARGNVPWSWIQFAPTLFVALAFLCFGVLRPALNFDLIPYATLAKELRGAGEKDEVYQELKAKVGPADF